MGKSWPGARKTDKLKAKRKQRGGEVAEAKSRTQAAEARLAAGPWVTSSEAALVLGLSHQQVLVALTNGRLTGHRDKGRFVVRSDSVTAYRNAQAESESSATESSE